MIYTSYYAQLKNFPENYHPIGISQFPPKWYEGAVLKDLAPLPYIINTWNKYAKNLLPNTPDRIKWEEWYNKKFKTEIIDKLNVNEIIEKLCNITNIDNNILPIWENPNEHIVLCCFEKSEDFCHRNIIANWFNENNIPCREITKDELLKEKDILQVEQLDRIEKRINNEQIENTNTEVSLDDIDMDIR